MHRLKNEDEILDSKVRRMLVEAIEGTEERQRRARSYKAYKVYKDQTELFVYYLLSKQFSPETVSEMRYAISNISIMKKIVDKLARVYSPGVKRSVINEDSSSNDELTNSLHKMAEKHCINTAMKTVNRYLKAARNTALYLKPCLQEKDGENKYYVKPTPLFSHLYSVVEDYYDRTRPMGFILSNFDAHEHLYTTLDPGYLHGFIKSQTSGTPSTAEGDGKDSVLADAKEDEGKSDKYESKRYIWWSDKYHVTMNYKGDIIDKDTGETINVVSPDDERILNPIEMNPVIDFNIDQDNSYWSEGGDDLSNGACILNSLITQANHIAVVQGYGQFYMIGKDLPGTVISGPSKTILINQEEGDPTPQIGFASANPPLQELWSIIESQLALLLTTNNLSTSGVKTSLSATGGASSGISLMIDKAESMEDVEDQRQVFVDKEQRVFKVINAWLNEFGDQNLYDNYQDLILPEDFMMTVEFNKNKAIQSEAEHLDNIQKRKDLGINEAHELIMIDQPNLSEEDAKQKLLRIEDEKKQRMASFAPMPASESVEEEEDQVGDDDEGNEDDTEQ